MNLEDKNHFISFALTKQLNFRLEDKTRKSLKLERHIFRESFRLKEIDMGHDYCSLINFVNFRMRYTKLSVYYQLCCSQEHMADILLFQ